MKETPLSHNRHFCRQHGDNTFFLKCEQCSGRLRRYLVLCVFRDQLKRISRIDYVRWKCGMRSSFSHFFSYPRQQALISHTGTGITDTSSADFFPCFYALYKRLKKLLALIQKHTAKKNVYVAQITEGFLVQRRFICILGNLSLQNTIFKLLQNITAAKSFYRDLLHQLIC